MRINDATGTYFYSSTASRIFSIFAIVAFPVGAVTLDMQQTAFAGSCTAGAVSVCSGPASAGDTGQSIYDSSPIVVTTDPGFGLTITGGGNGIEIYGDTGIVFEDNNASTITTDGQFAIYASNGASGNLSILSTGSLISTSGSGEGIRIYNSGADTSVRTHDTEGGVNGINVNHYGSGSIEVISTGTATGGSATGISVYANSGTSLTIEAVDTHGATEGIFATNWTTGALVIKSTGSAVGTSLRGILADNYGTDVSVTAVDTWGGNMGISVNNHGTGFLEVTSTGTATGWAAGLSTDSDTTSTRSTINAVDTVGNGWGIYAIHNGSGPISVTSTGTATGTDYFGIAVETGSGTSAINVTANNAQGGRHGIRTNHGSSAGTPGNAVTITVTGTVLGGTGYGIWTASNAGVMTNINIQASAVVGSTAGNAIANDDGDSNTVVAAGGTVNGRVSLGLGSDRITLDGGLSGITVLDGGGGGTDILNLSNAAGATHAAGDILNWTEINLDNSYLALTGGGIAVGTAGDMATGIFLRNRSTLDGSQDDFSLAGNLSLASGTRFFASGNGSGTTTVSGNVLNAGLISMAGGGAGDILRIGGSYVGQDGMIVLETRLEDDLSITDRLIIDGDTSGSSLVSVINIGGTGAATNEGIEVITVAGTSGGTFTLLGDYEIDGEQVVAADAYAYRLVKGNRTGTETNNWYLRSEFLDSTDPEEPLYQAGVPVYEAYPQALLELNRLSTLQQRVGNRLWLNDANEEQTADGIWARIDGAYNRLDPHSSTAGSSFDQNVFRVQAGIDGTLIDGADGALIGGLFTHYTRGVADTYSRHGDGQIATNGYGLGGTLTWYGDDGSYFDGQAQITAYSSDLRSTTARRSLVSGNDALGYALSLEGGKRISLGGDWSTTPQAQLVYSGLDFDGFTDSFGAPVSLDEGAGLQGRLGLTLDREATWTSDDGLTSRFHAYGIANLHYAFLSDTRVDVAGESFDFRKARFWGGVGSGGTYSWNGGSHSLYAEGFVTTSLDGFGESYSLQGKFGFRVIW